MDTQGVRESGTKSFADAGVPSSAETREMAPAGVVIGYNHDIPYGGRIYHVQTEDSGRSKGHINTHVFHSGTIVASSKLDYDRVTQAPRIMELARESHKTMMRRLIHGELDDEIARCSGRELPLVPANGPHTKDGIDGDQDERIQRIQRIIEELDMDNISQTLENLRTNVAGALGVALVDYESGMCLGTSGTGINLDVAAAGNMEVMKAKARVMRDLGIKGGIEDILITLDTQYHVIRPVGTRLFLYLAIDRKQGNLALARHRLTTAAAEIHV